MTKQRYLWRLLIGFGTVLLAASALRAQGVTGTILGTVADEQGNVMPGATVTVTDSGTGYSRTLTSNAKGAFRFEALPPASYTVKVAARNFKTYERKNNVLSPSDVLSLGEIKLVVGQVEEMVTVEAHGAYVETDSSAHSALLTAKQVENLSVKGRDVTSLLRLLPGVSYVDDPDALGGTFGSDLPNIGGARQNFSTITVDGAPGNELSRANKTSAIMNLDAIAEVKVLLNNYQAEYNSSAGANIQIVGKTGSNDFHGSAYYYKRHENFNANRYFNNLQGLNRARYRYDTLGATFGGPLTVPGLLKPQKDKLFFFVSTEYAPTTTPQGIQRITVPTALERQGDFSQSVDSSNRKYTITDPATDKQPFANNVIPSDRINRSTQALLGLFPLPNVSREASGGQFNYEYVGSKGQDRLNTVVRLDWKPTPQDSLFLSVRLWHNAQKGDGVSAGPPAWGLYKQYYIYDSNSYTVGHTHVFGSSLLNEASGGIRYDSETTKAVSQADVDRITRSTIGWSVPQLNPNLNQLDVIPNARFGGISNAPQITIPDRYPLYALDGVFFFKDTLSYGWGNHTFKGGVSWTYDRNNEGDGGVWNGQFDFGTDSNNPFNTGNPWSNALLGVYKTYNEVTKRSGPRNRRHTLEWFVQDSWKPNRRLTLDLGMRFLWYQYWWQADQLASNFSPERYDPAKAPRLYRPTLVDGKRKGYDAATGQVVPESLIGAYVPNSGDINNGIVLARDPTYPRGFRDQLPPHPEPRLGLAWDVFGNGKTALRASGGLFHHYRFVGGTTRNYAANPPIRQTPQIWYNSFDVLYTGTARAYQFPGDVSSTERHAKTPSTYNWQIGFQQDLGFDTVASVNYVGSVGRHLEIASNLNEVQDGMKFVASLPGDPEGLVLHPENADPTKPTSPLGDNFLRTNYPGLANLYTRSDWGTSNYNALQVQVNRRFTKGLQFSVAYTYSKAMGISNGDSGDADTSDVSLQRPVREWLYGPLKYDQTHNLQINYTYDLPRGSRIWENAVTRLLLDNWELSGTNSFVSGRWQEVFITSTPSFDFTGGTGGGGENDNNASMRPVVIGDPVLGKGDRSALRWFDINAFARPQRGNHGNAPRVSFRLPAVNNWDLSLFKRFRLGGGRSLQLRLEAFNVLNHTEFSGVKSDLQFDSAGRIANSRQYVDASGNQPNLAARLGTMVGEVSSTRPPRIVQASMRFTF